MLDNLLYISKLERDLRFFEFIIFFDKCLPSQGKILPSEIQKCYVAENQGKKSFAKKDNSSCIW